MKGEKEPEWILERLALLLVMHMSNELCEGVSSTEDGAFCDRIIC